jgi:hypothetical protein
VLTGTGLMAMLWPALAASILAAGHVLGWLHWVLTPSPQRSPQWDRLVAEVPTSILILAAALAMIAWTATNRLTPTGTRSGDRRPPPC